MAKNIDHVVMLAAGMGRRLAAINPGRPKALFVLRGRTLLDRGLEFAHSLLPETVTVVAGCGADQIKRHVDCGPWRAATVVETPRYADAGNLLSLLAAAPGLVGSTLIMNVDHVYSPAIAEVVRGVGGGVTIVTDSARALTEDDMKVELDERGHVKYIAKDASKYQCGYIGLTYVPRDALHRYVALAAAVSVQLGPSASVECVLQATIDAGGIVAASDIKGLAWYEIDTPSDAQTALESMSWT